MNMVDYARETMADWSNTVNNTLNSWDETIASIPDQITSEMNRWEETASRFFENAISEAEAFYGNIKTMAEELLSADSVFSLKLW